MRVRPIVIAAVLAALLPSFLAEAESASVRREALARSADTADVYLNAYRAQSLADGSRFVIYRSPVPREPSALAAALIHPDGAVDRLTAAGWIAPEELAPETIGQIYAASMSPDGTMLAVSIGWRHAREGGTNAVALLRRSDDGWRVSRLIRGLSSTGDLLLTKSGLLLALTADRRRGDAAGTTPPLLTVMTLDGQVLLEAFPTASADPDLTQRNRSRLGMNKGAYTLFDAERNQVLFFDLRVRKDGLPRRAEPQDRDLPVTFTSGPAVDLRLIRTVPLSAGDPASSDSMIEDAHVYADGTIAVVRSMLPDENDGIATLVTLQSPDGTSRSWHPDGTFFKPVFWENDRLVGIARGATPESDLIVNSVVFK